MEKAVTRCGGRRKFEPFKVYISLRGEIGRHKGFKIPRPLVVPVRVWPEAPKKDCTFIVLKV